MLRRRLVLTCSFVAPLLAACAAVIGVEKLPLREDAGPIEVAEVTPPREEADACADPDASFCTRACNAYDFCDDFEDIAHPFARWNTPGIVTKPLMQGPLTGSVEVHHSGEVERGYVLHAVANSTNLAVTNGLVHAFEHHSRSGVPVGLEVRGVVRIDRMESDRLQRESYFLGIGQLGLPIEIVNITLIHSSASDVAITLMQAQVDVQDTPRHELFQRIPRARSELLDVWLPFLVVLGPKSRLIEEGYACDPDMSVLDPDAGAVDAGFDAGPDPQIGYMRFAGIERCGILTGAFADATWLTAPGAVLFSGASVIGGNTIAVSLDDIAARFL